MLKSLFKLFLRVFIFIYLGNKECNFSLYFLGELILAQNQFSLLPTASRKRKQKGSQKVTQEMFNFFLNNFKQKF